MLLAQYISSALIASLVAVPTLRLCASHSTARYVGQWIFLEFWLFWAQPQPIIRVKLIQKAAHTSSFRLSLSLSSWAVMQHLYPGTLQPNWACSDATVPLLCFHTSSA